jgi:galactonate dehydratase
MAETIETDFHFALIKHTMTVEGGYIPVPMGAGLGIEVDEALARAHPFTGTGLHLQMQTGPVSYHEANIFEGGAPSKPV